MRSSALGCTTAPRRWTAVLCALALLPALPAIADIVYLKNGKQIEGAVSRNAKTRKVAVKTPSGVVVELSEEDVVRIVEAKTAADELVERLERLEKDDLDGLVALAVWAREKRLRPQIRDVCRRILAIDPNHELARRELGYVVFENNWVLESELNKRRGEKGLVKFRGEWMREEERRARLVDEERREIANLFESVVSRNRYVQEYAVRQLMAYRGAAGRAVFEPYLEDRRELVRIVAMSGLTNFPARDGAADPDAARLTAVLFGKLLGEVGSAEMKALHVALRLLHPRESFRLALERLSDPAADEVVRSRAGEVIFQTLRKAWVPELCKAVVIEKDGRKQPAPGVRATLRRALGVDLGDEPSRWLEWWSVHQKDFRDQS